MMGGGLSDDKIEKLQSDVSHLLQEMQKQQGVIAGLQVAIHALVHTHRNPADLRIELDGGLEITEAMFLGGLESEAGLAAFQDIRERLNDSLQVAIDRFHEFDENDPTQ